MRYEKFCRVAFSTETLFLEQGVGYNTSGIIKFPLKDGHNQPQIQVRLCQHGIVPVPPAAGAGPWDWIWT